MCIKKIDAYTDSKGGVFTTERCAIESEIGIITGMGHDEVLTLIGKASPLVPLLQRVLAIAPPPVKDKAPVAEPTTLSPQALYGRRAALLGRIQNWAQTGPGKNKAKGFISSGGYENLPDLMERATDADIEKMHAELTEKGVA